MLQMDSKGIAKPMSLMQLACVRGYITIVILLSLYHAYLVINSMVSLSISSHHKHSILVSRSQITPSPSPTPQCLPLLFHMEEDSYPPGECWEVDYTDIKVKQHFMVPHSSTIQQSTYILPVLHICRFTGPSSTPILCFG